MKLFKDILWQECYQCVLARLHEIHWVFWRMRVFGRIQIHQDAPTRYFIFGWRCDFVPYAAAYFAYEFDTFFGFGVSAHQTRQKTRKLATWT